MGKILTIVRHGKSDWGNNIQDIDRPLKERGVKDAYKMAERLQNRTLNPDLIITSTANRAVHTAIIFSRVLKIDDSKIILNSDFYMADYTSIIQFISRLYNSVNSVLIFGHNPTFTYLANMFLPDSISNLPTAGVVSLNFETNSWHEFLKSKLVDYFIDSPKNKL
ncbi:MAG: histidine phosphatase family protein [Bacteroidales bacterium]|nr:histidine phosphatase family protein [Bacteroidales bacterium]